jgi:hypothetical protein
MFPEEPAEEGTVSEEWVGEVPVFGFGICSGRWKGSAPGKPDRSIAD